MAESAGRNVKAPSPNCADPQCWQWRSRDQICKANPDNNGLVRILQLSFLRVRECRGVEGNAGFGLQGSYNWGSVAMTTKIATEDFCGESGSDDVRSCRRAKQYADLVPNPCLRARVISWPRVLFPAFSLLEVKRNYWDRDVCRLYLTGLCPHDLFQLTKMDLGPCSKVHSLQLRKEYEEAKTNGKDNYDRDLEDCLEKPIIECDRKILRALKRLEDDDAGAATAIAVSEVTKSAEASEYTRQIKEKFKSAEYLEFWISS